MKTKSIYSIQLILISFVIMSWQKGLSQSETINVESFNKVIVSPHIQVVFKEGKEESVTIESITESRDKLNIEVNGKTLRIYLDDAKLTTKQEKVDYDEWERKESIYKGTVVVAIITYKNLAELSLRGDQRFSIESPLALEKFKLSIYGESQVYFNEVDMKTLKITIYGESLLEIKKGEVDYQKITAYGESTINTIGVDNRLVKITAYGEGSYRVKVSENLKVTAYGEADILYEGDPDVNKGIVIGEARIHRLRM